MARKAGRQDDDDSGDGAQNDPDNGCGHGLALWIWFAVFGGDV